MDPKKKVKTRSIDPKNLFETHLSIQLSLDGFSFCVIDKSYNLVQELVYHEFEEKAGTPENLLARIEELFKREELLKYKYGSVNVSHVNELSAPVPKSLFDETNLKSYIRYSSKTYENDYVVYDEVEDHDMINVYIPFVNVNNFLLDQFGSFEYKHFSTTLLSNLLNTYRFSEHPHLFVHLEKSRMYLVAISNSKLQLYNSFSFSTKEDFIYYILFVLEQLSMDPETVELVLSGQIDIDSPLYKIAYTYVRKISLIENRFKYDFVNGIDEVAKRRNMTLVQQF
jgi:hypothetical protein